MLILISGKQGSGKTTLSKNLQSELIDEGYTVYRGRFAAPLYEMHDAVRSVLKQYSYSNYDYSKKDGPLLQLLGTEWGREMDPDIWVNIVKEHYKSTLHMYQTMCEKEAMNKYLYIVEDCRFKNELFSFPEALSIRLEASEELRKERCEMWRDRTEHPSEIDLDQAAKDGKFDIVINADENDASEVLQVAITTIKNSINFREKQNELSKTSRDSGPLSP